MNVLFTILLLSPNVKKCGQSIWTNLNPLYQWVAFCQVWLKLTQWFWRRRFFKIINVFLLFRNHHPLEKGEPFIWTNLNPLHPKMLCAKFGWNWSSCSEEENFQNLSMYFCYLLIISPWKRMFCVRFWLKLAQWFWRR